MTLGDSGLTSAAARATITIIGSAIAASTDNDGRFVLDRVPAGAHTLRARLFGYGAAEREIRVDGDTVQIEIVLRPQVQLLSPISTDARTADVDLFMSKPNVGALTMNADAMAGVPSVGERDVMRVVQLLPGVGARNDFNTGLNVRGGEADQNLILLDGFPIYNPFHLGGLFSTFMDATVGGIDLMTAAFPARYGGRLSSVLDVRSVDDAAAGLQGSADLSVLSTSARLTDSFHAGRGAWSVAGRRTYADAVASVFTNQVFPYHFQDVQARATYALPRNARVAVTAYAGKDVLDINLAEFAGDSAETFAGEGQWAFDWGNRVVGASIVKDFGRTTLEQRVSTSGFSTLLDVGAGAQSQRNKIRDLRFAGSLLARRAAHDWSIGYEIATYRIRYASSSSQTGTSDFDLVQRPMSGAVWIDDLWRVSSRWLLEGGLRGEGLTGDGHDWMALSPRVSVKYFATPSLALSAGAGRVTQWLHSLAGDGPLRIFDVWIASDSLIPVASAWHYVAGAERRLRDGASVRVEGYVKRYDRVPDVNRSEDPQQRGDELYPAAGLSYGVDLLARRQPSNGRTWDGWISYSYGVSTRSRAGMRWAPGYDRRHELDVVTTRSLAKYRVGARFGFATGTPYTPIVGQIARRVYDPSLDTWDTGDPEVPLESIGGARNTARFPATHRLDLDVSRDFEVRGATLTPYVNVVNAYNAKNVFVYLYKYSTDQPTRRAISQFPVLPSLGVRVVF